MDTSDIGQHAPSTQGVLRPQYSPRHSVREWYSHSSLPGRHRSAVVLRVCTVVYSLCKTSCAVLPITPQDLGFGPGWSSVTDGR